MSKLSMSIPDQLRQLSDRGLNDTRGTLPRAIMDHGYFRLSGYWRYFQLDPAAGRNTFEHGVDFAEVSEIYSLDARLRNLLLEGLSEIEISLRSILTAKLCGAGGTGDEYLSPSTYRNGSNKDSALVSRLTSDIWTDIERSKERHVVHYRNKGAVPMWVAVEALSFGVLSRIYGLLANEEQRNSVARRFGYTDGLEGRFASNLRAVAVFRNACAHHSRIWNRHVRADVPFIPRALIEKGTSRQDYQNTAWGVIVVTADMVSHVRRDDSFRRDVDELTRAYPAYMLGLMSPSTK